MASHPRAKTQTGLDQLQRWIRAHKLTAFVRLTLADRTLSVTVNEQALENSALLDGCYTLETNVSLAHRDATTVAARYLDLQKVERNFRTLKTGLREVRPIFLRNGARTKGHVSASMLALKITRAFEDRLHQASRTTDDNPHAVDLDEALTALSRIS